MMKNIITDRLLIQQLTIEHAAFILELLNTAGWLQYIGDRKVKTLVDAENYILNGPVKSYEKNGFGLWIVIHKTESKAIGICGLIKRDTLEDVDIGFAFLPEYNGHGYAFEASHACLKYGQNKLSLKRIVAITTLENTKSISLLEKLGMKFENTIQFPNETEVLNLYATQEA